MESTEQVDQSTTEPNATEILRNLLKRAAHAHGLHEKAIGKPDPDWPDWYAEHMTEELRKAGYLIRRRPGA